MIIYCITNQINEKRYIGQHIGDDLQKYWRNSYVDRINRNLRGRPHLFRAIKKHGFINFEIHEILRVETKEELDFHEKRLIADWNTLSPNGYNLTAGGGGGSYGYVQSAETREKKRQASTGRRHTEKWKQEMSERMKGNTYGKKNLGVSRRPHTEQEKVEISRILLGNKRRQGIPHSEEVKKLISEQSIIYWQKVKAGILPCPNIFRVRNEKGRFAKSK